MRSIMKRGVMNALAASALAAGVGLAASPGAHAVARAPAAVAAASTGCTGTVNIYGTLSDGRLTFSRINAASHTHTQTLTGANLGFLPKTLTTLNANTVLATTAGGALYRIDVSSNVTALNYTKLLLVGSGWIHNHLTYDGSSLYGTLPTTGELLRYTLTVNGNGTKPRGANITARTVIGRSGFGSLKTLTATAPARLLATSVIGELVSYRANGLNSYNRYPLRPSGWGGVRNLLSAGSGIFYGQSASALSGYRDTNPTDGSGADLSSATTVTTTGWSQTKLSSQPNTVTCANTTGPVTYPQLVTMFGPRVGSQATVEAGLPSLNAAMAAGNITAPARKSAFLATLVNESRVAYNAAEGGTFKYHGRGLMQLTGDFNYRPAGTYLGVDLINYPDRAKTLPYSANIARWYWTVARPGTNAAADNWDMGLVSRYIGYAPSSAEDLERCNDFKSAMKFFTGTRPADSAVKCYRPAATLMAGTVVGGTVVGPDDYLRTDPEAFGKTGQRVSSATHTTR